MHFFNVRDFHPNAPSYRDKCIAALFRKHELDKKREYGDWIREVENGSFTPVVTWSFEQQDVPVKKQLWFIKD